VLEQRQYLSRLKNEEKRRLYKYMMKAMGIVLFRISLSRLHLVLFDHVERCTAYCSTSHVILDDRNCVHVRRRSSTLYT
jgi:hypothetical protein